MSTPRTSPAPRHHRARTRRLKHVQVFGLFGFVEHSFPVALREPTILTGPNGVGKTQILGLLRSVLKLDVARIAGIPFDAIVIQFATEPGLRVARIAGEDEDAPTRVLFQCQRNGLDVGEACIVSAGEASPQPIPDFLHEMPDGTWYDAHSERFLPSSRMRRMYGTAGTSLIGEAPHGQEILDCVNGTNPIFIDTKRLDTLSFSRSESSASQRRYLSGGPGAPSRFAARRPSTRIEQYVDQLRLQVAEARSASVAETQSADLSFAVRALAAAHDTVNEKALRDRYGRIVEQYEALTRNGLATGEEPLKFPDDTTPTIRRILNVFLDDWERRLKPLLPVNEKLTVLRRILDEKLSATSKRTTINQNGRLGFTDSRGRTIAVRNLSSGEQHLVALYTMLLFGAPAGSLLLIDEPEISMHAAWKHAFLSDMTEVSRLSQLQVVLATHSTGIINGRWDLTVELAPGVAHDSSPSRDDALDASPELESLSDSDDWVD